MAHADIVFEDEDGLSAAAGFFRHGFLIGWRRRRGYARKVNVDGCAFAFLAFDTQMSAALTDNAVRRGKTKSAAVIVDLRGEERLEEMSFDLFIHSGAGIADSDQDILAGSNVIVGQRRFFFRRNIDNRRLEGELSAMRHRISRIYREVENDLGNLTRVGLDMGAGFFVVKVADHGNVFADQPEQGALTLGVE